MSQCDLPIWDEFGHSNRNLSYLGRFLGNFCAGLVEQNLNCKSDKAVIAYLPRDWRKSWLLLPPLPFAKTKIRFVSSRTIVGTVHHRRYFGLNGAAQVTVSPDTNN